MPTLPQPIASLVESLSGEKYAIATAALAYATGDAFGVAYEFEPRVKPPIPQVMLGKTDWPAGGVSDDTLLSLMTIACLEAKSAEAARELFIEKLRAAAKTLRGLGPTTRHALGIFVEEREVGIIGTTNGGMMRTALLSLAFSNQPTRQHWVSELCSATHSKPESLWCALVMAEVFNSVLERETPATALAHALEILEIPTDLKFRMSQPAVFADAGISLNPIESLLAVIDIANSSETVWQAYEHAICSGGDTDTIAALSSALVALKNPDSYYALPFIAEVNWSEIPELTERINQLIESRSKA